MLPENRRSGVAINDPATAAERAAVAATCAARLELRMPMAIDAPDNAVGSVYGGWPDRLYLVDRDGRIAYQGEDGPFGFRPDELEQAIVALPAAVRV